MERDAWFFIGIFAFIFIIWIAVGGPTRPIAFTGPTIKGPFPLGGGTSIQLPRAPFGIGGSNISLPGSSGAAGTQEPLPLFAGGRFSEISPYRGLVKMNRFVSGAGSANPVNESIELSVPQNAGVPVDISGWSFSSDISGKVSKIPKGTEVPISGTINASEDIVLTPGTKALVISGSSPIGASFRENKCIGYFSTFQKFTPALPQNCPVPEDGVAFFYGPAYDRDIACVSAVRKFSRCQVVLTPPTNVSSACQSAIVKYLNYNGCVNAHKNNADFMGDTWRVYLGRTNALWRTGHEIVRLLDMNGKTVDAFSY